VENRVLRRQNKLLRIRLLLHGTFVNLPAPPPTAIIGYAFSADPGPRRDSREADLGDPNE
jgi:hypothetical protein